MHAEREETGRACSSIKAPVNYTVPWDVNARQHPRIMTELCGFNCETLNQSASLPLSPQHKPRVPHVSRPSSVTLTHCSARTSAHTPPPCPLPHPALGTDGPARP